ncbi:MAG: permease prefix domain 1-containing protein, partial [Victivallales bacterium]
MNDEIHKTSEIAASGLKADSELYLSVRRELEVHLEESAENLENSGQNHDQAIETALKKFGSPAEAASDILQVNKKRMKSRARFRLALITFLPLIALGVMLVTVIPEWEYWQLKQEMSLSITKELIKKTALAAGASLEQPTLRQQLLLACDWKKLHKMFPESKEYFANYFMSAMKTDYWTNGYAQQHPPVAPKWLKKARKTDPGNALYDYCAAAELLYFGSKYRKRRSTGAVTDRVKLMEALPYYLNGLKQPFYRNYRSEITRQRLALNRGSENPASELFTSCLRCWNICDYGITEYIEQAIPMWAEELIKVGKPQQAKLILDSWSRFILQHGKYHSDFYMYAECMRMLKVLEKKLPPLYRKIGKSAEAAETQKQLSRITRSWTRRWNKKTPEKVAIRQIFFEHAPRIQHYLGSMLLPEEYKPEELLPGRLREYARADRILLLLIEVLLSCLMLGYGICQLLVRLRLKKNLQPILFIPKGITLLKLVTIGIVVPLFLWRLLILLQPGGRDYALTCSSVNFLFQGVFLILGMTVWPMVITHYCVENHLKELGINVRPRRNGIISVLLMGFLTVILACLPWQLWFSVDIVKWFEGVLMPEMLRFYPDLHILKWLYPLLPLALLAFLFIVVKPAKVLYNWSNPDNLFRYGASLAAMFVVSAIMLISAALLADGYFYWREVHFIKLNPVTNKEGNILYRDRIMRNGNAELNRILSSLQTYNADINNIAIDYILTDAESFCKMIKTSPYLALEKALKAGANANAVDDDKYTALMLACRDRDVKVVKLLLAHGAKVNTWCPGKKHSP